MPSYHLGIYGQDEWHARSDLTLTVALRAEHQSNLVCETRCFARLAGPFNAVSHDPNQPYNAAILSQSETSISRSRQHSVVTAFQLRLATIRCQAQHGPARWNWCLLRFCGQHRSGSSPTIHRSRIPLRSRETFCRPVKTTAYFRRRQPPISVCECF